MSKDNVKKMFGKIEKDAGLQKKYAELMQGHSKEAEKSLAEKLIGFGKAEGFSFSKDDLLAARAEVIDRINSNKELSAEDLSKVAGGGTQKGIVLALSITTAGIGCALASVMGEIDGKGGCGRFLSATTKC